MFPYGAPIISSVTGCTPSGSRTTDCLSSTTITVTGSNFGISAASVDTVSALTATVAGYTCTSVTVTTPHTVFTCKLPVGPTGPDLYHVVLQPRQVVIISIIKVH
jgi:hypothetical protein